MNDKKYWREYAACKGMDTDMFFPERGDNKSLVREARKVCSNCDVRKHCLDYALTIPDDRYGIFGGFTNTERMIIRRLMKRNPNVALFELIEVERLVKENK